MAERRQQIEELFHAALERDSTERASYLAEMCSSDPALRAEVESLISAHEQPGNFLDSLTEEIAPTLAAASQAESLVGRSLGQYEVIAFLGRGGMGDVYLARDRRLERKVALKLLPLKFTADEIRLRRFVLEARAASSLNHPNILTIHEVGEAGSIRFMATEFVDGQTLRKRISRGAVEAAEAIDIAIQIASALAAAHAAGIVHRDVKPENIMVRPDGYVKVLDFGLAKLTEHRTLVTDTDAATVGKFDTDPGIVMGTTNYLSPEQARGLNVDARSDIFSLGVVIYEMISSRLPFEGATPADVIAAILKTEPAPLGEVAPGAPIELQQIVAMALSKDRETRYQSSEDILRQLKAVKQELEFASKLDQRSGSTELSPLPRRQHRLVPFLALALLVTFLTVVLLWYRGSLPFQAQSPSYAGLEFIDLVRWGSLPGEINITASFSPDGSMIAYGAIGGREGISVKQVTTPAAEPTRITDGEDDWGPIWSPDNRHLAFVSSRGGQTGIWSVSVSGGPPTLLKTFGPDAGVDTSRPITRYWSKVRGAIYYELGSNLFALDIDSNVVTPITNFEPFKPPYKHFSVSPDEDHFAYTDTKNGQIDVWVSSLTGGDAAPITSDPEVDDYPLWHPDGKRIIYRSHRDGAFQVCEAYLDGRTPRQITVGGGDRLVLDISSDGTRILADSSREEADIYGVEIESGKEVEVTSDAGMELWPDVSSDGRMLLFQSNNALNRLVSASIITKPLSAGGQQVQRASEGFEPSWAPNGSRLAFLRFSGGKVDIFTVNGAGDEEQQLTTGGVTASGFVLLPCNRTHTKSYSWSPDAGGIAYVSRKSGPANVWAIQVDGQADTQVTTNTDSNLIFSCPLWSPDGRQIAYVSETKAAIGSSKKLWSISIAGRLGSDVILKADSFLRLVGWSDPGGELIVGQVADGSPTSLATTVVNLLAVTTSGSKRSIASLESANIRSIKLSPNRQAIAFVSNREGPDNLCVIPANGGRERKITQNNELKRYLASPAWSADGRTVYYSKQTSYRVISMIDKFQ